ncbi:PDZ domain-containing protein [Luteimonas yindakuii]|uniref:PDZ domain-containing protein n=1 Tax=Luteimonas yindakuii TaxID=2565782 RepID=A0A4Z1QZT1_9GAMM|nr:PDZ domain-containing protein [Luteimonas yindakuii]TKS52762.1 PDZ domain-containing protein [Luteimonas yindakuii]
MIRRPPAIAALALAVALVTGAASAQDSDNRTLEQARADLQRAAARVAALSADTAAHAVRRHTRPVLGVVLAPDADAGVRIAAVTPGSAADDAGLRSGDRLVAIGSTAILGRDGELRLDNARGLLRGLTATTPVRLDYERAARRASVTVTPRPGTGVAVLSGTELARTLEGVREGLDGVDMREVGERVRIATSGIGDEVARALAAAGVDANCGGSDCGTPRLLSAVRWSGLNLAALDADLGRYFGTDRGVLVLSTGSIDGLRAGDVIQRVDGQPVATPRDVMQRLRDRNEGERVSITYLRDRRTGTADVAVPRQRALRLVAPPAPPAPPRPPAAPRPPAPPAPPPDAG